MRDPLVEAELEVQRFIEKLTSEEQMLVILKQELYEGKWQEMVADLHARLAGKPYIFKLANRIEDDLERIQCLWAFEKKMKLDLSDFIKLENLSHGLARVVDRIG